MKKKVIIIVLCCIAVLTFLAAYFATVIETDDPSESTVSGLKGVTVYSDIVHPDTGKHEDWENIEYWENKYPDVSFDGRRVVMYYAEIDNETDTTLENAAFFVNYSKIEDEGFEILNIDEVQKENLNSYSVGVLYDKGSNVLEMSALEISVPEDYTDDEINNVVQSTIYANYFVDGKPYYNYCEEFLQ